MLDGEDLGLGCCRACGVHGRLSGLDSWKFYRCYACDETSNFVI